MAEDQAERIAGLDIGTNKVVALIGETTDDGNVEIVGIGTHQSRGIRKGAVVNIESTVQSIQRAVEEAESMAGSEIHGVYVGIAGDHVRGTNSHGIVPLVSEVLDEDIDRVLEAAQAVVVPADQQVLHALLQEYLVNDQEGVKDPLGMSGVRLEARVHLVTCAVNAVQNIEKCIGRCGLEVHDVILEQLASSYAVLTDDERELGVCVIDIGGGTTDIAVFSGGAIRHTAVIPIAGDQVTNDIAVALRTPTGAAEDIKIRYACALAQLTSADQVIKVPGIGNKPSRNLSRQALAEVVGPRYEELFTLVQGELRRSGFESLIASGIVLTGGASKMEGVVELAEEIFNVPVSIGAPGHVQGLKDIIQNPIYSTGVGLVLYGKEQRGKRTGPDKLRGSSLFGRFKRWLGNNF